MPRSAAAAAGILAFRRTEWGSEMAPELNKVDMDVAATERAVIELSDVADGLDEAWAKASLLGVAGLGTGSPGQTFLGLGPMGARFMADYAPRAAQIAQEASAAVAATQGLSDAGFQSVVDYAAADARSAGTLNQVPRDGVYARGVGESRPSPKRTDMEIDPATGQVVPQSDKLPNPKGLSTYDSLHNLDRAFPSSEHAYRLPEPDVEHLPPGLAYFEDGANFGNGGNAPEGHITIYPTEPMSKSAFTKLIKKLHWQRAE
ncbi:hypothetical protein [Amycolatopsis sp. WGS_07]|uniref:hypothetical protein n=1 Tax=Amycolatopsis sp. WGS_07 TaxID=3076764 RepID=UPI0038733DBA